MAKDDIHQQIIDLENARIEALTSGDVEAVGMLMAEDLVHIHGNGHMDDRSAYLDGVANKFKFHRIERSGLKIRVYDNAVVVNGAISQTVSVNGVDKINQLEGVATQTWMRSDDGWKQSTCHMHFLSVNGKPLL
jgi:hypothetical protein